MIAHLEQVRREKMREQTHGLSAIIRRSNLALQNVSRSKLADHGSTCERQEQIESTILIVHMY